MLSFLRNYLEQALGVILLIFVVVLTIQEIRFQRTKADLSTAKLAVEHLTNAMEAYKRISEAQDADLREAAQEAAQTAKEGAKKVLGTLTSADDVATREWALKKITELDQK